MTPQPGRREFIAILGSTGAVPLAGCLGDDEESPEGDEPEDSEEVSVTVNHENHEVDEATFTLRIRYSTKTVEEIPRQYGGASSGDETIFVVMEARISVQSAREGNVVVPQGVLGLEGGGSTYEPQRLQGLPEIENSVLPPATYRAWARFEVPIDIGTGTLTAVQPGYWFPLPTEILFESDEEIPVSL